MARRNRNILEDLGDFALVLLLALFMFAAGSVLYNFGTRLESPPAQSAVEHANAMEGPLP